MNVSGNSYYSVDGPAPLNYNIGSGVYGSYSDIHFKNKKPCGWRHAPCNVPLLKKPLIYQGTPLPLKNEMVYMPLPKDSMFVFQKNQARPECCPSTYSTSTGCVCTTSQQRKFVSITNGNNSNWTTNPEGL